MIGASRELSNAGAGLACGDCLLGVLAQLSRGGDVRQEGRPRGVRDRGVTSALMSERHRCTRGVTPLSMSVKDPYDAAGRIACVRPLSGVIVLVSKNSLVSSGQSGSQARRTGEQVRGIWSYR
jgi:hypothetical protein